MDGIANFFSPEAGQKRRAWLDGLNAQAGEAARYYLGPTGIPERAGAAANVAAMFSPGADVMDATTASGDLVRARSPMEAATAAAAMAGSLGSMFIPGNAQRAGEALTRFGTDESGALRLGGDIAAERGAQIMDMLKSGRAAEVTDEMLDIGGPVANARLNEWLFKNYDLPMDAASRAARAKSMGLFPQGSYRGAHSDVTKFSEDPVGRNFSSIGPTEGVEATRAGTFFSDNPAFADGYAARGASYPEGAVVGDYATPLAYPLPNSVAVSDWAYDEGLPGAQTLRHGIRESWQMLDGDAGQATKAYASKYPKPPRAFEFNEAQPSSFDPEAEVAGISSVVFDPRNIRSRFARFDPRLAHLRNLSAGVGGLGLASMFAPPSEEQQ